MPKYLPLALPAWILVVAGSFASMSSAYAHQPSNVGLVFNCGDNPALYSAVEQYLEALEISKSVFIKTPLRDGTTSFRLAAPFDDGNTLTLAERFQLGVKDELIELPTADGSLHTRVTVSKKEIALALMQKGRSTVFEGEACSAAALKEQVDIRQLTVAWTETLEWGWPEGSAAKWNTEFWSRGYLQPGARPSIAFNDALVNQKKYEIGCYTAAKFIMGQGVLDYYRRVNPNPEKLEAIERRMTAFGSPLSYMEPGAMWSFESETTPEDLARPGRLLKLQHDVQAKNFVPGDWVYMLNTDPVTYEKTGYEGSNAIYLGRGRFNDFYNDHGASFTYRQKLNEVYQWRNKVFSRSRDAAKIKPLTPEDIEALGLSPELGGLVLTLRAVPYYFGFEELPEVTP